MKNTCPRIRLQMMDFREKNSCTLFMKSFVDWKRSGSVDSTWDDNTQIHPTLKMQSETELHRTRKNETMLLSFHPLSEHQLASGVVERNEKSLSCENSILPRRAYQNFNSYPDRGRELSSNTARDTEAAPSLFPETSGNVYADAPLGPTNDHST